MRRLSEEWIRLANEDLQSAEYLFEKQLFRMVCYHAQQSVEKVLKALLAEKEAEVPRIHNLIDLNNSVKKLGFVTSLTDEEALFLNAIYRWRYPPDLGLLPAGEPTELDAQRALSIARATVDWSRNL
ncbi:MAG: HEPN domain-containing protein [Thermodesulfobacteriota bacterium]